MAQEPKLGSDNLTVEVSSHTKLQTHTHTHTVGLLCTSDQLVADAATYTTHNKHRRRTSTQSAGFEPAIPATKRLHNWVLDRADTGTSQETVLTINRLTPNDPYMGRTGRTAPLTSKHCILYIYSTNIGTEYFKHALYSPLFSLRNAVCFIMLTCLVPVLFTFYIQSVLKLKK